MKNFVEELRWRGMIHDIMPGTEEQLSEEVTTAYIGFDPTSDSLHIGSLVPIIILVHLHKCGHKPIALVGGATGMIGDPSGKSDERNLLDEESLNKNVEGIKRVLSRFLDFNAKEENAPVLVNNYDWMKEFSFIGFVRDVGKRITVNYMMAKDSVKKRLTGEAGSGMSFTEFTYQLIQGYDFYHLHKHYNCMLQLGGSDQWGNITTGTELVRRMNDEGAKAYAMTTPLITKADGSKFGKSEGGNIWLDADKTSVYKFYQFWLNTSDADAEKYIKIFTFLEQEEIEQLIEGHKQAPHLRVLQKKLAQEVTVFVHSQEAYEDAVKKAEFVFSNYDKAAIEAESEEFFTDIFGEFFKAPVKRSVLTEGEDIVVVLSDLTGIFPSRKEARKSLVANAVAINKVKVDEAYGLSSADLLFDKYILVSFGKKKNFVVPVED
ncbi:tyrosine--tRNA ligase [Flavobacterium sp. C4GT6]|uniref:tyrosine--tRNA ligase n=1 Tax=Flavobacterium sp. C4GT6 TaxID=3103818 RepID=UPI002ED3924D